MGFPCVPPCPDLVGWDLQVAGVAALALGSIVTAAGPVPLGAACAVLVVAAGKLTFDLVHDPGQGAVTTALYLVSLLDFRPYIKRMRKKKNESDERLGEPEAGSFQEARQSPNRTRYLSLKEEHSPSSTGDLSLEDAPQQNVELAVSLRLDDARMLRRRMRYDTF